MSTTANGEYRYETWTSNESIERQLFVSTAAMLTQKWPARDESDHKFIAERTVSLTRILAETYKREFLKEER